MPLLLSQDQLRTRKKDENMWQRRVRLVREEYAARLNRLRESDILDIIKLTPTEELARYLVPEVRAQINNRLFKEGGQEAVTAYDSRMRQMIARRMEKQVAEQVIPKE